MTRSGFVHFGCKITVTSCIPRGKLLQFQAFDESYVERLRSGDFRPRQHFVAYFSELNQLKLRSRLRTPQAIEDVRQETSPGFSLPCAAPEESVSPNGGRVRHSICKQRFARALRRRRAIARGG